MTSRSRTSRLTALAISAAAGVLLAWSPHAPRRAESPEEAERYPSEWFYLQRAFPSGTIDHAAFLAAVDRAAAARNRLTTSSGPTWMKAGPDTIGGRVTALAVAPGGTTLYLGSANGGVFKSTDSGVNWTPVFEGQFSFSIGALALDPTNPNTVYCGTGEANSAIDTYDGSGVYRTTDGGANWQYLGLDVTRRIGRVAVDPQSPSRIFVAALGTQFSTGPDRGLYRSEDGGTNWSKVLFVNDSTGCIDVAINPAHPETVFCSTWTRVRKPTYRRAFGPDCGIWRSIDHGSTWTRLTNGLPPPSDGVSRIGIAIAPSRPSVVYAQIISAPNYDGLGMYRSTDGGATWAKRDVAGFTGIFGGFGWYFGEAAVDPTNSDRVFALGQVMVVSTDGAAHFSGVQGNSHVDHHAMWIDPANPNHAYIGNDGGFWWTTAGGINWTHCKTLDITQFYAGTVDLSNPARLMGGSQDNSTLITTGGPGAWTDIFGGDGFYCVIDPTNPAILFAESQFGSGGGGPNRSTNSGAVGSWTAPTGINSGDRFNWNTPFVMSPKNHNLLLVGSQRVYRSTNNGVSYGAISGDLTTNTPANVVVYGTITTLDISGPDTSVYYAGTDDGKVWRSTNRGGSWTDISAGLPKRWVTRVTADPVDPQVVYVTHSGFYTDEHIAHVHRSTNRGTTWTPIGGGLPNIPVNDIVVDPSDTQRLYVATDVGVYWSANLGVSWEPLGAGLPFTAVFDLTLHAPSHTLIAATHGRSQWTIDVTPTAIAVAPEDRPARVALSAPAPNPSRSATSLTLELSRAGQADVTVFDAGGRRVRTILAGRLAAGSHRLGWNGTDDAGTRVGAGVYFVRARAAEGTARRRVVRVE